MYCIVLYWLVTHHWFAHPSTNRARRRATSLIETSALSLRQTRVGRGRGPSMDGLGWVGLGYSHTMRCVGLSS